jgi:curved DNA-binding protein CbpA
VTKRIFPFGTIPSITRLARWPPTSTTAGSMGRWPGRPHVAVAAARTLLETRPSWRSWPRSSGLHQSWPPPAEDNALTSGGAGASAGRAPQCRTSAKDQRALWRPRAAASATARGAARRLTEHDVWCASAGEHAAAFARSGACAAGYGPRVSSARWRSSPCAWTTRARSRRARRRGPAVRARRGRLRRGLAQQLMASTAARSLRGPRRPRDADEARSKRRLPRLARELHPDVNAPTPAPRRSSRRPPAYEIQLDADSARTFDRYGHEACARADGAETSRASGRSATSSTPSSAEAWAGSAPGRGRVLSRVATSPSRRRSTWPRRPRRHRRAELRGGRHLRALPRQRRGSRARRSRPASAAAGWAVAAAVSRTPFAGRSRARCPATSAAATGRVAHSRARAAMGAGARCAAEPCTSTVPAGIADGQRSGCPAGGHAG